MSLDKKYYQTCPLCGANSDQAEWIGSCVACRRQSLVRNTGGINWLEITLRFHSILERGEINEMTLIGVINWIAEQPEFQPKVAVTQTREELADMAIKFLESTKFSSASICYRMADFVLSLYPVKEGGGE